MIELSAEINGLPHPIYVAETAAEAKSFGKEIGPNQPWAFDVETNAYPIQHSKFKIRLAQFGDMEKAFVFPLEHRGLGRAIVRDKLEKLPIITAHVAKYDILSAVAEDLLVSTDAIADRYVDTRILAHLINPVGKEDGGIGLALKDLSEEYIDAEAKDSAKELRKHFKSLGFKTIEEGFRHVPLWDEIYLLYAGLDPILTAYLYDFLAPLVWEQQS